MTWCVLTMILIKRILLLLLLLPSFADAQLIRRETIEPGGGLIICQDAEVTDAYKCPASKPKIAAYSLDDPVLLTPATSNTGAATVEISGLSPITIVAHDGSTLPNNAIVAGRKYLLIYNGTNFLLYAVGTSGGAGLAGLNNNRILKASGSTNAIDSSCLDTGTSLDCGDLSGNYHSEVFSAATAAPNTHTWPAVTGTVAHTTGALTNGNCAKYDASGRLVDHGTPCAGAPDFTSSNFNTVAQSINNATLTVLTLNDENWDVPDWHSVSVNTGRITFDATVSCTVVGYVTFVGSAGGGGRGAYLRLNGTTFIGAFQVDAATNPADTTLSPVANYNFVATNYVELVVYQDSGGALNVGGASVPSTLSVRCS
jgi:hypothetical protein